MSKNWLKYFFLIFGVAVFGQSVQDTIDSKYLEDQFYFSASYNILVNKPKPNEDNLFSGGFSLGYMRDIPFNKRRNFGIGIGLGYDFNSYSKQITIFNDSNDDGGFSETYEVFKFRTNLVEIPFELRWRTSTATDYKFWRIYAGMNFGYVFSSKLKTKTDGEDLVIKNLSVFEKFKYGISFSAGYSTWNIYLYYGLNPIFKNVYTDQEQLNLKDLKIGLKFYIL